MWNHPVSALRLLDAERTVLLLLRFVSIFDKGYSCFPMKASSDQKTRIIIVLALALGWLAVFLLRSGTSWG